MNPEFAVALFANFPGGDTVVKPFVAGVSDVPQSVPLAALLRVVAFQKIVVSERTKRKDAVRQRRAAEQRRRGETEFGVQAEDLAGLDQTSRVHNTGGC